MVVGYPPKKGGCAQRVLGTNGSKTLSGPLAEEANRINDP